MSSLTWSSHALSDVQRLYRFLAFKNPDVARRAIRAIRASVQILDHQPQAGRPCEALGPEFREWVIEFGRDGYVVLYHHSATETVILAVRHGREAGYS